MDALSSKRRDLAFAWGLLRRHPFNCLVQVTNRCNMQCSFCDFWPNGASEPEELTLAEYEKLAGELDRMGTFLISIEGGEPLVRPDLVEIVRAFGRRHIQALFTNGWYVTAENARALFDAGLVHASVSIDYPDAARHDRKRALAGACDRAWRAVDRLRDAAPLGGKQVNVMTVLMEDNWRDLDALLGMTAERGVGHWITLLSLTGYRRGKAGPDAIPGAEMASPLLALFHRHPHLRVFEDYVTLMGDFLGGRAMPTCRAGLQSFNVDHVGNVSPCIEKIDWVAGNVRAESLRAIHARMAADRKAVEACQDCWTVCRGSSQLLGGGGSLRAFRDLAARMRAS
ncbi:MAG: radical SAM protein [Acidobacteriota bacterium]